MSKTALLMDEPPISVSPSLAQVFGINKAIVLQKLHYLLSGTETNNNLHNFVDGEWWVYNSYKGWRKEFFKWLSESALKTIFNELEKSGVIVSKQGLRNAYDRRKWYRIDYEVYNDMVTKYPFHETKSVPSQRTKNSPSKQTKSIPSISVSTSVESSVQEQDIASGDAIEAFMEDAIEIVDTEFSKPDVKPVKVKKLPAPKPIPVIDPDFKKQIGVTFKAFGNHATGIAEMLLGVAKRGEYAQNNITPALTLDELKAYYDFRVRHKGGAQYIPQKIINIQSSILEWRASRNYDYWQHQQAQRVKPPAITQSEAQSSAPDTSQSIRERMYADPFGGN